MKWPRKVRGFSLPEIMVSLAIGLLLLAAFVVVLDRCRREFAANESLASLQAAARGAMAVLASDLEHAGFLGAASGAELQVTRDGIVTARAAELRQPGPDSDAPPVAGLPAAIHDCGSNFAVDLSTPIEGANNTFATGVGARDCAPTATAGGARVGSDNLTVRHASLAATEAHAGRLQLYAHRLRSHEAAMLFADGRAPDLLDEHAEIRDVEVHIYYVANHSVGRRGWPALRVKSLTEARGAPQFRDEEILTGVEDLQVEFGVADASHATQFLQPGSPSLRGRHVMAVRLWLRIRADSTERGFVDPRGFEYSDATFVPGSAESRQRRLLIEHTITLRNRWPP